MKKLFLALLLTTITNRIAHAGPFMALGEELGGIAGEVVEAPFDVAGSIFGEEDGDYYDEGDYEEDYYE